MLKVETSGIKELLEAHDDKLDLLIWLFRILDLLENGPSMKYELEPEERHKEKLYVCNEYTYVQVALILTFIKIRIFPDYRSALRPDD